MDVRSFIRPLVTGLVLLGIVALVIVLLVKAFSGNGSTPKSVVDLGKYSDTAAVTTLLIDGPINIDQDHRQVKIIVSNTTNEIDIIQGYQGTVIKSQVYPNNSSAYGAFLQSLKLMNFAKGNDDSKLADYRGYCPTGDRYVYGFNDGTHDVFQYWSTSCSQGTFKGNAAATLNLFRRQIPAKDFNTFTNSVPLGF